MRITLIPHSLSQLSHGDGNYGNHRVALKGLHIHANLLRTPHIGSECLILCCVVYLDDIGILWGVQGCRTQLGQRIHFWIFILCVIILSKIHSCSVLGRSSDLGFGLIMNKNLWMSTGQCLWLQQQTQRGRLSSDELVQLDHEPKPTRKNIL